MSQPDDHASVASIVSYHAHVYFRDARERETAASLRDAIAARFAVRLGRWHDRLVGPHALPMYQVAFAVEELPRLLPWLMLNRRGLCILVHPNTSNPRRDHVQGAAWLGEMLPIMHPEQLPEAPEDEETDHLPLQAGPPLPAPPG